MKQKKTILSWVKLIFAVVLVSVTLAGTTGCAEIIQIVQQYLGEDFYLGGGSVSYGDSVYATEQVYPTDARLYPDLPDKDFKGYNFRILADKNSRDLIFAAEENGDVINDATYMRNMRVSDQYNIKINAALYDESQNILRKSVKSGSDDFDAIAIPMDLTAQLAPQGYLINLYDIPYIDFSKPWWGYKVPEQLSISNQLYYMTNDMLTSDMDAASVFFFNKMLFKDYGLENPYTLVKNGLWTVDKMNEMSKSASRDLNGDGKMSLDDDLFGLITGANMLYHSVLSSGSFAIEKDKNDLPAVNMTERMADTFKKWSDIFYDGMNTVMLDNSKDKIAIFNQSRGLFMNDFMAITSEMRRNETDFGIVPNPKYDVTQESYINAVNPAVAGVISIPVTNPDLDRTGVILESLAAESRYTLMPAYYDISLKTKFYRDEESAEMLDIIYATRCYDLGQIYNIGGINDIIADTAKNKEGNLSRYEKSEDKIKAAAEKLIYMFDSLK